MANGTDGPNFSQLMAIGIDYARTAQPVPIFVAGIMILQLVNGMFAALPGLGLLVSLAAAVGSIYLAMLLVRHALTGQFGTQDGDGGRVLKLAAFAVGLVIASMVIGGVLLYILLDARSVAGIPIVSLALVIGMIWVVARFGFYLPATAVGHETSLAQAFAQSQHYWGRIMGVMIVPAIATMLAHSLLIWLLPGLVGLLIALAIGGVIGALGGVVTLSAIAYLYANVVHAQATGRG